MIIVTTVPGFLKVKARFGQVSDKVGQGFVWPTKVHTKFLRYVTTFILEIQKIKPPKHLFFNFWGPQSLFWSSLIILDTRMGPLRALAAKFVGLKL